MKFFFKCMLFACLFWSCDPSPSDGTPGEWTAVRSGVENKLTSISFVDHTYGWAVGDNVILFSDNGGKSWTTQFSSAHVNLTSVWFIDRNNGWVAGASGKIMKTSNGGQTWEDISVETKKSFHDIRFANSKKGWAVGYDSSPEGALVATTDDGGASWVNQRFVNVNHVYNGKQVYYSMDKVFALDDKRVWASGNGQWFVTSATGGVLWDDLSDKTPLGEHRSFFFHDELNGWMLSPPGKIYKTTDGGHTWSMVYLAVHDLFAITFTSPETGWAVGEYSTIVSTKDGGKTWSSQSINLEYTTDLNQVFFVDSTRGWIVGNNGVLLRYWK